MAVEAYIAEFVGTFMLVLTVGCNVIVGSPVWGATSIACVLMVCIYALGDVSGANFNPAVSLALAMTNKMDEQNSTENWRKAKIFMLVQLMGGLLAACVYTVILGKSFNLQPAKGYGWFEVALAEMLYTFMLCFVVLNTAASKADARNQYFGIAIGFVIVAGGYAVGHVGAGCFNPAVAFGIDATSASLGFGWCLVYIGAELLGAVLASVLFPMCRVEENSPNAVAPGQRSLGARCLSEFIGTYFLMLTVGLNVLGGSTAAVWSIAASLMCMIYALGSVSGAHFNPAVTVAIHCAHPKNANVQDSAAYVGTQLVGGISAALTCAAMSHGKAFPLKPAHPYGIYEAWACEFCFTFLLCFVVLSVAVVKPENGKLNQYFGLAIGSCVTVGGLAIGAVSGGSLNPAVTAGANFAYLLMNGGSDQVFHWIAYSVVELLAGAFAACIFYAARENTEYSTSGKGVRTL